MCSPESLSPTESLEIENGLTLVPRVKLTLTVFPQNTSVTKPVNEWQVKQALIDFLKTSLTPSITIAVNDLEIRRHRDIKKRKRDEPVARGTLFIRDLGFLKSKEKFSNWRSVLIEKLDGIELNLEGAKYKLIVNLPVSDEFERMRKEIDEYYVFRGDRGREADTIIVRDVPCRWFAEPRVSLKPSMLVTHTIFSFFGKIRNLYVAEDNDIGKDADEDNKGLISGLNCKIVVQFEKKSDFWNALKMLCGRSLQKEGSRLKADFEVTWDKDDFFQISRSQTKDKDSSWPARVGVGQYRREASRQQELDGSHLNSDDTRRKRFKIETIATRLGKSFSVLSENNLSDLSIRSPITDEIGDISLKHLSLYIYTINDLVYSINPSR
ncbi:hypothetical protein ACFE04_004568 [Oxalis oulophora]